jgi:four helix bundle protein
MNRRNHNFRTLKVWEEAIDLVVEIYKEAAKYPREEKYGIISQIQRACVSIPANIAECSARETNPDFVRFFYISKGSIAEVITLLSVAAKLRITIQESVDSIIEKLIHIDNSIFKLKNTLDKQS